jgi:NAD(P)-dependent dehydrogenase (short-subunit alcohol dehydrogenase family)
MARWFEGKSVLVTGASSGIGAATAQRFAAEGASVCLADRDRAGLDRVVGLVAKSGGTAVTVEVDISRLDDNARMVRRALDTFGKIDVAFLDAGYLGTLGGFDQVDFAGFDRIIQTNLYGCFYGIKSLYPKMERNGAIVVTASIAGLQGLPENPAYAASKHGVVGLVRSSAAALAARGVRINAICPGAVSTPMIGAPQSDVLVPPDSLAAPDYRGVSAPQHVAELALFLASARAAAVTGASYTIDAGWTATLGPQPAQSG